MINERGVFDSDIIYECLSSNANSLPENYDIRTLRDYVVKIIESLSNGIENESDPINVANLKRQRLGVLSLMHSPTSDTSKEVIQPLFDNPNVKRALTTSSNIQSEILGSLLENHISQEELKELLKREIPLSFEDISGLSSQELEFVKQRFLREARDGSVRRTFFLQAIVYMGYSYVHRPKDNGSSSMYGINIRDFCDDFVLKRPTLGNVLAGDKNFGNPTIMQLIDAIAFYNENKTLSGFSRQAQSIKSTETLLPGITEQQVSTISTLGRKVRTDKLLDKLGVNLGDITSENILEYYAICIAYTGKDTQKVIKVIKHFADFSQHPLSYGKSGIQLSSLERVVNVSRQRLAQILHEQAGDPRSVLLRILVHIADTNERKNTFSSDLYDELRSQVLA